jgi:outer membrane protein TolC
MPRIVLAVLGIALLSPPIAAQEFLTLDSATAQALAGNARLLAARAAARESDARHREARAAYFPRVSFSETWQRGNQPVYVFGSLLGARQFTAAHFAVDALNRPEPSGFFRSMVSAEQLLFDGGRRRAARDAAAHGRDLAAADQDLLAGSIVVEVADTYGRVLMAQAARTAADAAVAAADEDLARARRRRDAGTATEADVLAIAVHLAEMQRRSIQAAADLSTARARLNHLMGVEITREYRLAEAAATGAAPSADLAALFAEAEAARPELRRARAAQAAAETGRRQARAMWLPQVAAQAAFEADGLRVADRAAAWLFGGELRWTLSIGGAEIERYRAAGEAAARARLQLDDARAAVHVDVVSSVHRVEAARARQAVGRSSVEQARESQRIIRDRYGAGLAGITDVLRAAAALLDADTERVAALADRITSEAHLRRALGRVP